MRLTQLRVSDLMTTAVVTVKASELLTHAQAQMQLLDVRHMPVVDDRAHVIGILSNRDVFRSPAHRTKRRIADVMTRPVLTVRPETSACHAVELMLQYKIGALPVIGPEEQLVGVITETDLLRVAHEALGGHSADALQPDTLRDL